MSASIDALLAELAAAELQYREYIAELVRVEEAHGRDSVESYALNRHGYPFHKRREAATDAVRKYAVTWAAERAQSFVAASNEASR